MEITKFRTEVKEYKNSSRGWGNGYVTIPFDSNAYKILTLNDFNYWGLGISEEITYEKKTECGFIIGFDTQHSWNDKTHNKDYVVDRVNEIRIKLEVLNYLDFLKARDSKISELTSKINELLLM